MKRLLKYFFKALGVSILAWFCYVLVVSSLDIYNNFAYEKAVLRHTPYGFTPLLGDVSNYGSWQDKIKAGQYVYVEDWTSQRNGRVIFAKVRSGLHTGYVNRDMLVESNINPMPVVSVMILSFILVLLTRKIYKHYSNKNCTQQKLKLRYANQF